MKELMRQDGSETRSSGHNLAWGRGPAPSRGPRPALSPTQIARVAIQIADADGLESMTMKRVAQELGVTTMALYRYFPGKADLVGLMIDSAGESAPPFRKSSSPWHKRLKLWAHSCLSIYREHPWFLEATSARHNLMGPNELSWMEAALKMLAESGLSPKERHYAFLAIIGHVRGYATFKEMGKHIASDQQWVQDLLYYLRTEADRFPESLEVLGSDTSTETSDIAFDFGLDCILTGIRAKIRKRSARSHRLI
jgi:AcrR family transcriptional regulator